MEAIQPAEDLIIQQHDLEDEMTEIGKSLHKVRTDKAREFGVEDRTEYGNALLDRHLPHVVKVLENFMAERREGKAGRKGAAFKYLSKMEDNLEVVAFVSLRLTIANLSAQHVKYNSLAIRIGRSIEDEYNYANVRAADRKAYQTMQAEAKKRAAVHVRRKVVNRYLEQRGFGRDNAWPDKDLAVLGSTILEAIIQTGLIEKSFEVVPNRRNTTATYVCATDHIRKFVADMDQSVGLMRPMYEPMIVPPADWSSPYNGGYLTNRVKAVRLVKVRQRSYLNSLIDLDMGEIYEAVNAAQKTAWTINPFILTILNMAWEREYSLGGIPPKTALPVPPKPYDIDTNEDARREWRSAAAKVHSENRELDSKRFSFLQTMNTANRYQLFPKLYMPYQLDFRGRIYAVPRLNPQGPDWMKALLMFSEGKPIDEESAPFLAIQVCNTGAFEKMDKAPLEDRVRWVYENEEKIIAVAENPIDNRWWTEADSPYCFLAACREWAGYLREGDGFISHLPVALDGSCSGIQHFSMALADEVGGAAVNLVPSEKPADIYSLVMDQALVQARQDASTGGDDQDVAGAWLRSGLMTRSCFKRPTMTFGYGSSQYGFREQIEVDTLRPALRDYQKGKGPWYFEDNGFGPSLYMAKVTQQAVEKTVVKAAEAMQWLKEVAKVVTSEGLPVRWTTPDGFPVVQHYRDRKTHRVDTIVFGSRVTMVIEPKEADLKEKPAVSKRKQASGLSPNFVHSLDATHLRMAVCQAVREGILDIALVHDSFGTHAADTGRFFVILRETLVRLYTETDVIQDFTEQMQAQLPPKRREEVPQPPAKGNLDLTAVLDSDFAFA